MSKSTNIGIEISTLKLTPFVPLFLYYLIQQVFIEYLLRARLYAKGLGYCGEQNTWGFVITEHKL